MAAWDEDQQQKIKYPDNAGSIHLSNETRAGQDVNIDGYYSNCIHDKICTKNRSRNKAGLIKHIL